MAESAFRKFESLRDYIPWLVQNAKDYYGVDLKVPETDNEEELAREAVKSMLDVGLMIKPKDKKILPVSEAEKKEIDRAKKISMAIKKAEEDRKDQSTNKEASP